MGKLLPENWIEVQFAILLESLETGSRPKGGVQNIMEGIPSIGGEHLNSHGGFNFDKIKFIPKDYAVKIKRGLIKNNDILIVKDGATTGKISFVDDTFPYEISFVNEHVFLCRVKKVICSKCIYYFLRSSIGQQRLLDNFAGAAQGGINTKFSTNTLIPLPPFAEQKRIADRLDILFEQLETVRKITGRIPQLLKHFRQRVLTDAITGKLTENWRKNRGLGKWRNELAEQCCKKVQSGGTPKGGKFELTGIPFLKVYNIVQNKIDFEYAPQYVSEDIQNTQIRKSIVFPGDVIMNIVGPPLNKIAVIPDTYPEWNINQAITLFRPKEYLNTLFLYYFFCEGTPVHNLVNQTRGVVGQVNISLSQCRNFSIPIPPIEEQEEIVNRVKLLFDKIDEVEQRYQVLKKKIDNLPQAILHKAFKGELVEQLPTDGDAANLLKEIEELGKTLKTRK